MFGLNTTAERNTDGPIDADLANLVIALESLSEGPLLDEIAEAPSSDTKLSGGTDTGPGRVHGLKRKFAASLTSLAMVVGITGMAWAAQGAQPGDWNHGLTQAMRSLGIEFGTAPDRIAELAANHENHPGEGQGHDNNSKATGLLRASEAVGSSNPSHIRDEVVALLTHLHESGRINGRDIAAWAKTMAAEKKASAGENKPDDTGKPANPGKP